MFRNIVILCFGVLVSVSGNAEYEQFWIAKIFMPHAMKCSSEIALSKDEFDTLTKAKPPQANPCFTACPLKGSGVINIEGKFDLNAFSEAVDLALSNSEQREDVKKIGESCLSVNEREVSDGSKGCELAIILIGCLGNIKVNVDQSDWKLKQNSNL